MNKDLNFARSNYMFSNFVNGIIIILFSLFPYVMYIDKLTFNHLLFKVIISVACIFLILIRHQNMINIIFPAVFLLYFYLVSFFSSDPSSSFQYMGFFLFAYVVFIYLVTQVDIVINSIRYQLLLSSVLVIGIFLSIFTKNVYMAIMQKIYFPETINSILFQHNSMSRYSGFLPFAGICAFFVSIGIGIILINLFLIKSHKNFVHIIFQLLLLFAFIFALLITGSRIMILGSIISFIIITLFTQKQLRKGITTFLMTLMIFAIIVLIVLYILPDSSNPILQYFTRTASINDRFILYKLAWQLFLQNPIWGHGINTFISFTYLNYLNEHTFAHNVFIQLLAETGIIGTLLFMAFLCRFYFISIKIINKVDEFTKEEKIAILLSFFVQNLFLIYCFTGNPIYDYPLLFIYFFMCSITQGYYIRFKRQYKNIQNDSGCQLAGNKSYE